MRKSWYTAGGQNKDFRAGARSRSSQRLSFEWGARLPKIVRKLSNYYTLILPFAPTVSCVCGCSRDSTSSWNTDDPSAFLSLDVFSERNLAEGLLEKSPHPAHADRRTCSGSAAGAIKCLARPPFFKIRRKAELCLIIKSLEGRRVGKIALIFLNASIASIFYIDAILDFSVQCLMGRLVQTCPDSLLEIPDCVIPRKSARKFGYTSQGCSLFRVSEMLFHSLLEATWNSNRKFWLISKACVFA